MQGRTVDEALVNVREAIEASLETRRAQGLPMAVDVVEVEVEAPMGLVSCAHSSERPS